jgi:hypothetical protein
VVGLKGVKFSEVASNFFVNDLKINLANQSGFGIDDIDIYFGGEEMIDGTEISKYGLENQSIIICTVRSRL